MIAAIFSVLTAFTFASYSAAAITGKPFAEAAIAAHPVQQKPAVATGAYSGTIPCADCEGIQMVLTLQEEAGGRNRTFRLTSTYLGKPAGQNTFESSGTWFAAKGNSQDPDAVILQLIPTSGNYDPSYFLQVSSSELRMLDREQNEIKTEQNYTLKKQR